MDELQAAVLRVKLRRLDDSNAKRGDIAARYGAQIQCSGVKLPAVRQQSSGVFHLYVLQTAERAQLMAHLDRHGVQSGIHYPMPIHQQPAYSERVRRSESMGVTDKLAGEVLSLPMYPELSASEVNLVIDTVNQYSGAAA